ncbi:MAG: undecaprenyldiphospho-muramoylpentapeptide beta-N-acetylglucosaminyltransferase [Cellvibrionaceae bacterium]
MTQASSVNRVLMMAGGTGGHVFPALTIARELQEQGVDIQWLGTQKGIESRLVPDAGITLHTIDVTGIRGKGLMAKLLAPFKILVAITQARKVIKELQPKLVFGLGGFASGPGGVAARLMGLPLFIHEQNAVAGTTNRLLQKIATRVFEAFKGSLPTAEYVGNPVRKEIVNISKATADKVIDETTADKPTVLVLGGSQGALALNQLVPLAMSLLSDDLRPRIIHQTGANQKASVQASYKKVGVSAEVSEFITDMAGAYSQADLVVCRSGALTVAELLVVGIPAVFVPYPYAIDDHQTKNAAAVVNAGGGLLRPQSELTAENLAEDLNDLLSSHEKLSEMADAVKKLAVTDAASRMAAACMEKIQ